MGGNPLAVPRGRRQIAEIKGLTEGGSTKDTVVYRAFSEGLDPPLLRSPIP